MTEPYTPLPAGLVAILQDLPLEQLAFTPVPVKPRHDGWTPQRQRGFVLRLALAGCVAAAARGVGKSSASAYALRKRADAGSFAAAWDKACGWGVDRMTDAALERALVGEARPVFYRGRQVGTQIRHDHRLAIAVLGRMDRVARLGRKAGRDLDDLDRHLDALG